MTKQSSSYALLLVACVAGFILALNASAAKEGDLRKIAVVNAKVQSTGLASVVYDTTRGAEFLGHYYLGDGAINSLYQAFLAIHFDELDSTLTFHSRIGRTHLGRGFPGDSNQFSPATRLDSVHTDSLQIYQLTYNLKNKTSQFRIRQIVTTRLDSTNIIYVDFVFEFPERRTTDTTRFTNFRVLFGYDGDIGSTTGGYSNDSSGYYEDQDVSAVYVADHDTSYPLYAGVVLRNHREAGRPGNLAMLHQTINDSDWTWAALDSFLFAKMETPLFDPGIGLSDVSVYWTLDFGTIEPIQTVRDTMRLAFVNAPSLEQFVQAARGQRLPLKDRRVPPTPVTPTVRLHQNAPNPFNPLTRIRYEVDDATDVRIEIFNVLGQKIRTLVDGRQEKDFYEVTWDGRNEQGMSAASGVYFYRLVTSDRSIVRKMLFVK